MYDGLTLLYMLTVDGRCSIYTALNRYIMFKSGLRFSTEIVTPALKCVTRFYSGTTHEATTALDTFFVRNPNVSSMSINATVFGDSCHVSNTIFI